MRHISTFGNPDRLWTFLLLLTTVSVHAQTTIEIGTGALLNSSFQAPSPYANVEPGGRCQLLYLAGELQAAGMGPGSIIGLGFHVEQASGATLNSYSIRMGQTNATALNQNWLTGLSDVWGPLNYTDTAGWSLHQFSTPFTWDGVSNVVVETCYYNPFSTQNARVYQSSTTNVSFVTRSSPNPAICTDPGGTHFSWQQRPNVRFQWMPLEVPPVISPFAIPAFSCSGSVHFFTNSNSLIDSWAWDFGDGQTDNSADPVHTYASSGNYTATLIAINSYGADTAEVPVTVQLDATPPVPACAAPSSGTVAGFGVLDVSINGIAHPSGEAATEGYLDNTCQPVALVQGTPMPISITTANGAAQAVRAWVDWDNSGTFTSNEIVASGTGPSVVAAPLVPQTAVLGTHLRLRAIAAYNLITPTPAPCDTVFYGQAEDYSVIVSANTASPIADFSAAPTSSCDGSVQFTDLSLNAPTAWTWDFGDGGNSQDQDPFHVYATSGTYSVLLIAINANGQDDTLRTDLITVDLSGQLIPASCIPNTQAYCCGYGILGFHFAGINSTSANAIEGYQDRSCGNTALVQEGLSYVWSVTTLAGTPHDVRIWIDVNNDGSFTADELLATALNVISPSGNALIPASTALNTPVRVRVQADVIGQSSGPCDAPLYGQTEDFSAFITPNMMPPVAAFNGTPTTTCVGLVQFHDLSTHTPTAWAWDFGDGTTSTVQNPIHTYGAAGEYTVSLMATNDFGSNTTTHNSYIAVVESWQCDTASTSQTDQVLSDCQGLLADDGGPYDNYFPGNSGAVTINAGTGNITLNFLEFQWGNNQNRHLAIYDGPSVTSPLILDLSGNSVPGNAIVSTGPSITLRQEQSGGGGPTYTGSGFLLEWSCLPVGIHEVDDRSGTNIHPVPAEDHFTVDLFDRTTQPSEFSVIDVNGRTIYRQTVPVGSMTIQVNCANWPSGTYAVRSLNRNGEGWSKAIVIH